MLNCIISVSYVVRPWNSRAWRTCMDRTAGARTAAKVAPPSLEYSRSICRSHVWESICPGPGGSTHALNSRWSALCTTMPLL